MPQAETIIHEGKVLRVPGDGMAEVEILVSEACAGCQAKSVCSPGKSETKVVMARTRSHLKPGDRVTVEMKLSQGFRALAIGYVLPFVVLIAAFVVLILPAQVNCFRHCCRLQPLPGIISWCGC
ncbi:MAG: SoxR reducing system RseC family protein [Bacteroidales bacterium]